MKAKIREKAMSPMSLRQLPPIGAGPGQPGDGAELRRFARYPYPGRVRSVNDGNREMAALDLSAGGVGLLSAQQLEIGRLMVLAFLGGTVAVKGVVSSVRPGRWRDWRVGIAFLQPEHELVEVARMEVTRALL
jgi:hypothetical protein